MDKGKILILTKYFHPVESGSEKTSRYISHYMAERGREVHIFSIYGSRDILDDRIRFHKMPVSGIYRIMTAHKYLKELADILFTLPVIMRIAAVNSIGCIYIHYTEAMGFAGIVAARILGIKSVVLWPGSCLYHYKKSENSISYMANKIYSKLASSFIAKGMSPEQFRHYFRISPKRLFHTVNPVEFTDYFSDKLPVKKPDKMAILYLGKFNDYKRPDILIEAVSMLKHKNIEVHFYGNGPYEQKMKDMVAELKLEDRVFIHKPDSNVKTIMKDFHIFVFPSPYESAYSQSLLEAMAASRITILKYTEGIRKYFPADAVLGIKKMTPRNLAGKLEFALENYQECRIIAEKGSAIVKEKFSFDYFLKQTETII